MTIADPELIRVNKEQWTAYLRLRDAAALRARTERSRALRRLGRLISRKLSQLILQIVRRRGSGPLMTRSAVGARPCGVTGR